MLSSFPSLRTKQSLTKDQNSCMVLLIGICSIFAVVLSYFGSQELYKLQTLVIHHCQVKSLGLKYERNSFSPRWNVTVIYDNETKVDFLIKSVGIRSERWAWIKARKYKINETYSCYRSQNETSLIQWDWQWDKPTKLKAYAFLFVGVILCVIATGLLILKRHFYVEFKNIQQQEQAAVPLTYHKAVQHSIRSETRV